MLRRDNDLEDNAETNTLPIPPILKFERDAFVGEEMIGLRRTFRGHRKSSFPPTHIVLVTSIHD